MVLIIEINEFTGLCGVFAVMRAWMYITYSL